MTRTTRILLAIIGGLIVLHIGGFLMLNGKLNDLRTTLEGRDHALESYRRLTNAMLRTHDVQPGPVVRELKAAGDLEVEISTGITTVRPAGTDITGDFYGLELKRGTDGLLERVEPYKP